MDILHIITGLNKGGAEVVLYRLISADRNNNHVVISMMDYGHYGIPLERSGVSVHCLFMPLGKITFKGLFKLFLLVRNIQPSIIQTWMYHADFIGGIIGYIAGHRKIVWNVRNSVGVGNNLQFSTKLIVRICAILSHIIPVKIVVNSIEGSETHINIGYKREKISLIQNGYNIDDYSLKDQAKVYFREEIGVAKDIILFGMVANWHPIKGHTVLLKALQKLKELNVSKWRCILVGSNMDPMNDLLMDMVKQNKLENYIILLGSRNDIPTVMNSIDIHLLSSKSEGFPNAVAEAMASGTPCIVTDVGDSAIIVGDLGWKVPPSAPEPFCAAMVEALNEFGDQNQWTNRMANCRNRINEEFSQDRMSSSFQSLWKQIS